MGFNTRPSPYAPDAGPSSPLTEPGAAPRRVSCSSLLNRVQGDVPPRTPQKAQGILDITSDVLDDQKGGIGELPQA